MKYVIEKLKEEKNILLNKPYIERGKQLNIKDIMLSIYVSGETRNIEEWRIERLKN